MATILQLVPALESGGVERGTVEIAAALAAAGHRSLVMSGGGRMVPDLERAGSEHFVWPIGQKSLRALGLVRPLRRFFQEQAVDVVDVRSRMPAWVVWWAWSGLPHHQRPRLFTSVHGFNSVNRYSEILTRGERVVAVSESLRSFLLQHYPKLDPDRVTVIHRGVDSDYYHPKFHPSSVWYAEWREAFPQLAGKFVLTLPGRITRLKGHHDALEVLRRLLDRGVPAHLLLVGGTDPRKQGYRRELAQRIKALALSGDVTFAGQRSDLREILAASDVVLSLSEKPESFGRTTLEALSLGRPVLGYDHGGVGEQLTALMPGGRVPPGHIDEAVEHLARWFTEGPPVPHWPHPWTLAAMCERTLELYEQTASQGGGLARSG